MKKKLLVILLIITTIIMFNTFVMANNVQERQNEIKHLKAKIKKVKDVKRKVKILKRLGILYHREAALGNEEAVAKAIDYLKEAKMLSNSPAIRAWYGSALTLKGRYAFAFGKLYYSKKGIGILDEVINEAPKNIEARLVRGINSLYLPDFIFRRLDLAKEDLQYVINLANNNLQLVTKEELATAHLNLGKYYQKRNKQQLAINEWKRVIALGINQTQVKRAKEYIVEIKTTN